MKYKFIFVSVCIVGLIAGFAFQYRSSADTGRRVESRASWAKVHATTGELYSDSSLIVRGRVAAAKTRVISETLPIQGLTGELAERAKTVPEHILILEQGMRERGLKGTPEDLTPEQAQEIMETTTLKTEKIGEEVVRTPLTDSTIEVVEVIKGNADKEIVVTQLGGAMPTSGITSDKPILEFSESPLLKVGDEYIIFLMEHKGDEVTTQGRSYELVGPSGQFRIVGSQLENAMSIEDGLGLPSNLTQLLAEIRQHQQNGK